MVRVLLTAFEPYGNWKENSSWLTLVELTRDLPSFPAITTRLYPVEFDGMRAKLEQDLSADYQFALHLGQMPGAGQVVLEAIGLNVAGKPDQSPETYQPLVDGGDIAFHTSLPVSAWATRLRERDIPALVSYHAGTYLCNATLYLSHYLSEQHGYATKSAFIHLPLCPHQVANHQSDLPSLPTATKAEAIRVVLAKLCV